LFATLLSLMVLASLIFAPLAYAADVEPITTFESDQGMNGWTTTVGSNGGIGRNTENAYGGSWAIRAIGGGGSSGYETHTLEKAISTVGFENIYVTYWRDGDSVESGDRFIAEWYDGSTWRLLEDVGNYDDGGWDFLDWDLSSLPNGENADNNALFRVRFTFILSYSNDHGFVDDILIEGDVISTGTGTIGDFVWIDADGDGNRDGGENTGLSGVTVTLGGDGSDSEDTVGTTEPNYTFDGLPAGGYTVS
ncbi:unnamed protein product, partial [marine sediment metagenome]